MKVEIKSKGLKTILAVTVNKKYTNKNDEMLKELQKEVVLKGFRQEKFLQK